MTISELRDISIQSAYAYLDYLTKKNEGYSSIGVVSFRIDAPEVILSLRGRLSPYGTDGLEIQLYSNRYTQEQISIVRYDEDSGILVICPKDDLFHLFHRISSDQIKLISDLRFLVERVAHWYEKYGELISVPTMTPNVPLFSNEELSGGAASAEQYSAYYGVMTHPFSYVWGAPGTGKTRFVLSNCILSYVKENRRVLLLAPTNNAVEQMLSGVLDVLRSAGIPDHKVFRFGLPSKAFRTKYPACCESSETASLHRALEQELQAAQKRFARFQNYQKLLSIYQSSRRIAIQYDEWNKKINRRQVVGPLFNDLHSRISTQAQELKSYQLTSQRFRTWDHSFLGMLCKHFRPNYYTGRLSAFQEAEKSIPKALQNLNALQSEYDNIQDELYSLNQDIPALEASMKENAEALRVHLKAVFLSAELKKAFGSAYHLIPFYGGFKRADSLLQSLLKREATVFSEGTDPTPEFELLNSKISDLQKQLSDLDTGRHIPNVLVYAMTIDRFLSISPDTQPKFSHVFLDEAAYTSAIKGFPALSLHAPVTFFGDHAQLPPICNMNAGEHSLDCGADAAFLWTYPVVFADVILESKAIDFVFPAPAPKFTSLQLYPLTLTYRFGSELSDILSKFIYPVRLSSASTTPFHIFSIHCPHQKADSKNTSSAECRAAISLSHYFDAAGSSYAILTPYRLQLHMLSNANPNAAIRGKIMTIHGSQGREFDFVILSAVDCHKKYFMNSGLDIGKSVLNTAISRARKAVIILADFSSWHSDKQMLSHLIKHSSVLNLSNCSSLSTLLNP